MRREGAQSGCLERRRKKEVDSNPLIQFKSTSTTNKEPLCSRAKAGSYSSSGDGAAPESIRTPRHGSHDINQHHGGSADSTPARSTRVHSWIPRAAKDAPSLSNLDLEFSDEAPTAAFACSVPPSAPSIPPLPPCLGLRPEADDGITDATQPWPNRARWVTTAQRQRRQHMQGDN
jgi:hypothetical protein